MQCGRLGCRHLLLSGWFGAACAAGNESGIAAAGAVSRPVVPGLGLRKSRADVGALPAFSTGIDGCTHWQQCLTDPCRECMDHTGLPRPNIQTWTISGSISHEPVCEARGGGHGGNTTNL